MSLASVYSHIYRGIYVDIVSKGEINMNHFVGLGRLTRDAEVNYTQNGKVYCKFSIAIDRPFRKDQPKEADFINCTAFGKTAEAIGNYFHKGSRILVNGSLQVSSYTGKDGNKKQSVTVIVNGFDFIDSKNSASTANNGGFTNMGAQQELDDNFNF